MKRRDFIRDVGLIGGALVLTPEILFKVPVDYHKWYKDNYSWLVANILEHTISVAEYEGMQIFKTAYEYYKEPTDEFVNMLDHRNLRYHMFDMCYVVVFGKVHDYGTHRTMEGFLSRYGRLPNEDDKIEIEYLDKRFLHTVKLPQGNIIISEIRLKK